MNTSQNRTIFAEDIKNKNLNITREFNAPLATVWKAWTTAEILDQWWAPKPFKCNTKFMDFREGGKWHYNMKGPEGEIHWCRLDYETIKEGHEFTGSDCFTDESGEATNELPGVHWQNTFSATGENSSKVSIKLTFKTVEDIQKLTEMGFREGFTMGLENLDEVLLTLD